MSEDSCGINLAFKQLIRFLRQAQKRGCKNFVDVAFHMPKVWACIRHEPDNRALFAVWLGWPRDASIEQILTLPDRDLADILLCHPIIDAHSAWVKAPMLCHRMHVCGRLSAVFRYLNFRTDKRDDFTLPPEDLDHLASGGNFEALVVLQLDAFDHANRHGLDGKLTSDMTSMPMAGWSTRGGPVFGIQALMLARVLEALEIEFISPSFTLDSPPGDPGCFGCFLLPSQNATLGFGKPRPYAERTPEPVRRDAMIDDGLLRAPGGMMAFYMHLLATLSELGISTTRVLGLRPYPDLVQPDIARSGPDNASAADHR